MKAICAFEAIPYACLKVAIQLQMRFTYKGVIYDPSDFTYWGA